MSAAAWTRDFEATGALRGNARLAAVAGMIAEWVGGGRSGAEAYVPEREIVFADIGTDHAYLPIALCEAGIADRAIAADVREGPLAIAASHIGKAGLSDRIATRRSDGLSEIAPGEADVIAVCGMGGELVLAILDTNIATARAAEYLVFGPQSKIYETRAGLRARGFAIIAEDMVFADGKYYPLIGAVPSGSPGSEGTGAESAVLQASPGLTDGTDAELSECFLRYGRKLIEGNHPVLRQFLKKEEARLQAIGEHAAGDRREEIRKELFFCRKAIGMMEDAK